MRILLLLFSLCTLNLFAQMNFEKTYGVFLNPEMYFIQPLHEGGYIICGKSTNPADNSSDFSFFKTDVAGNVIWTKQLSDSTMDPGVAMNEWASTIREDADGDFIFGGCVHATDYNYGGAYYGRLDSNGALLSSVIKTTTWSTSVNALILKPGGNIVSTRDDSQGAGSHSNSLEINSPSCQLISGSSSGNFSLAKQALVEMPDGGYGSIGIEESYYFDPAFNNLPVVTKFDQSGHPLWTYRIHNEVFGSDTQFTALCATPDNGLLIAGFVQNSFRSIILTMFNSAGDSLWTKSLGGMQNEFPASIQQTTDGGFVIAGTRENDVLLIKLDANCNVTWSKTYGGSGADKAIYLQQTSDNGFVILASTITNGPDNIMIIKTDDSGNTTNSTTQTGKADPAGIYKLYPDPFSSTINLFLPGNQYSQFSIYDMTGRIVFSNNIFGESSRFDLSFLPDGCYYTFIPGYNGLHKSQMIVKH